MVCLVYLHCLCQYYAIIVWCIMSLNYVTAWLEDGAPWFYFSLLNLIETSSFLYVKVANARRTDTLLDDVIFGVGLCMFPRAHVLFDPADLAATVRRESGHPQSSGHHVEQLPLTLQFASVGDTNGIHTHTHTYGIHVLYGVEGLLYKASVLCLCISWSVIAGVTFHPDDDGSVDVHEAMRSLFFCSAVIRIVTPLQSVSALFIADIGRYIGHTAAELQEIRAGLIVLARGVRFMLWLGSSGLVAARCGADPLVALSGFGAGTLFIGLALHKSIEHALAVVSLLMSAPFKVGDFVKVTSGHLGQVVKIGFRTTHIRCKYDGQVVQVPNATLASTTVENLSSFEVREALCRSSVGEREEGLRVGRGTVIVVIWSNSWGCVGAEGKAAAAVGSWPAGGETGGGERAGAGGVQRSSDCELAAVPDVCCAGGRL